MALAWFLCVFSEMSCSLNSFKGGYIGVYIGDYYKGLLRGILGV